MKTAMYSHDVTFSRVTVGLLFLKLWALFLKYIQTLPKLPYPKKKRNPHHHWGEGVSYPAWEKIVLKCFLRNICFGKMLTLSRFLHQPGLFWKVNLQLAWLKYGSGVNQWRPGFKWDAFGNFKKSASHLQEDNQERRSYSFLLCSCVLALVFSSNKRC